MNYTSFLSQRKLPAQKPKAAVVTCKSVLHQWVQRKNNVINVKKKQKTEHGRVTSTDAILAFAVKHFTLF